MLKSQNKNKKKMFVLFIFFFCAQNTTNCSYKTYILYRKKKKRVFLNEILQTKYRYKKIKLCIKPTYLNCKKKKHTHTEIRRRRRQKNI